MIEIYFSYLGVYLICLLLFYIIGEFILYFLKVQINKAYTKLFSNLMVGLLVFVLIVAITATCGKTVLLGLLIPIVFILNAHFKTIKSSYTEKNTWKLPALSTVIFLIILAIGFYSLDFLVYAQADFLALKHGDDAFRAKVAYCIINYGVETVHIEYLYPSENSVTPYHYLEIWLCAGVSYIFHLNFLLCYSMIAYSMGIMLSIIGFLAILETIKILTWFDYDLALAFAFFQAPYLTLYNQIEFMQVVDVFTLSVANHSKLFPIYLFLIITALFWLNNQKQFSMYSLLSIPIIYISTAPAVLSSVCVISILFLLFSKQDGSFYKKNILVSFIVALYIGLFYWILSKNQDITTGGSKGLINMLFDSNYIKTSINVVGGTSIQIFVIYFGFIFLILLFFGYKALFKLGKENIFLLWLLLALYFSSLGSWAVLHTMKDAVQLFSNLMIPLLNIIFVVFIYLSSSLKLQKIYLSFVILVSIYSASLDIPATFQISPKHSKEYLEAIKKENIKHLGAYIKDSNDYKSIFSKNPDVEPLGATLSLFSSSTHAISLSVFETPIDSSGAYFETERKMVTSSAFYKFVQKQKEENTFQSIPESQAAFIDTYNISYLIVSGNVKLSSLLQSKIKKQFIDRKTKEKFIVLKHE